MSRGLSSQVLNAISSDVVRLGFFIEAHFDSGTDRLWTGVGNISWGGNSWVGGGELLTLSKASERSELSARGVEITLSGIPSEWLSHALDEHYQGRILNLYVGFFNSNWNLLANPIQYGGYLMDQMTIVRGSDSTIKMACESRLAILDKASPRRLTDEDQRLDFPNDEGLEYVTSIQKRDLSWPGSSGGGPGGVPPAEPPIP